MLIINKMKYGTKITININNFEQNRSDLQKIWQNPNSYFKIIDTKEIKEINNKLNAKININDTINNKLDKKIKININNTIDIIDPRKTLSFISDCTRSLCKFNRYQYKTRDVILKNLINELNSNKITKFNIAFINSFKLLTELFYLTELIKQGFIITEIHLLDPIYGDFLDQIELITPTISVCLLERLIDRNFLNTNKIGWMFYQFLEYFFVNNCPIDIYVHSNPFDFGQKNLHRIDVTIYIDGDTKMQDFVSDIAIKQVAHPNSINFITDFSKVNYFGYKADQLRILSYQYIDNRLPIKLINQIKKIIDTQNGILVTNALLNTANFDEIDGYLDKKFIKKIIYVDDLVYIGFILMLVMYAFFGRWAYISRNDFSYNLMYVYIIFIIIVIIYLIYKLMSYRLLSNLNSIKV